MADCHKCLFLAEDLVGLCSIVFLATLICLHSTKLDDDRLIMSMAVNEFFL